MKNILIAAALLASCTAAPAQSFTFSGELFRPPFGQEVRPWSGDLTIDGSFATLSTTEGHWSGNVEVTRDAAGLITDLEASFVHPYLDPIWGWFDPCYTIELSGLRVIYDYYVSAIYSGTANLVPAVSAVPEPETYALMVAGLGLLLSRRKAKV